MVGALLSVLVVLSSEGVRAQAIQLEEVGQIPGPVELVRVSGEFAYVVGGHTFTVYDLSDRSAPVARSSYVFPEEIWGFRLAGDRAYVGANFFGLGILDISNPDELRLISQHKTLGQTKIGDVAHGKVGIIDHMEGFVLVDLADEAAPQGVGSFFLDGYARDVVTEGSYAYATDSPSGLYIFDLSRTGEPNPVGVLHAPSAPRGIEVVPGDADRPTLIVGAGGGDVQVYDVSSPESPSKIATFETPGRATRLSVDAGHAYVADSDSGVQVVALTNPSAPALVGMFSTPRPARDVSADGDLVLVVVGDSEREGDDRRVLILQRQ